MAAGTQVMPRLATVSVASNMSLLNSNVTGLTSHVSSINLAFVNLIQGINQSAGALETSSQSLKEKMTTAVDSGVSRLTQGMATAGVSAGKAAMNFESSFVKLEKKFKLSGQAAEDYQNQLMNAGAKIGIDASTFVKTVSSATQTGDTKEQALATAKTATSASKAWEDSLDNTLAQLNGWRNALGLSQEEALKLADVTTALDTKTGVSAKDIAAVTSSQGRGAIDAGLGAEAISALAASLLGSGSTTNEAGAALNVIAGGLNKLALGADTSTYTALGLDQGKVEKAMQAGGKDSQAVLVQVLNKLKGLSTEEQAKVKKDLFGDKSGVAINQLLAKSTDEKVGLSNSLAVASDDKQTRGSLAKQQGPATRAELMAKLNASFSALTITIGDKLLPIIDAVIPPLTQAVTSITEFVQSNGGLILGIIGVTTAVATGFLAFKKIKSVLGIFKSGSMADSLGMGGGACCCASAGSVSTGSLEQLSGSERNRESGQSNSSDARNRENRSSNRGRRRRSVVARIRSAPRSAGRGLSKLLRLGGSLGKGTLTTGRNMASSGLSLGKGLATRSQGAAKGLFSSGAKLFKGATGVASRVGGNTALLGAAGGVLATKALGKVFKPLSALMSAGDVISGVKEKDSKKAGKALGDISGGLAGAAMGAALGTAIFPGVGTLIGGAIGGLAGSELGATVGEYVGGWFSDDKTEQAAPNAVAEPTQAMINQANRGQAGKQMLDTKQAINFAPVINMTPSGDPSYDTKVSQDILAKIKAELTPLLVGNMDVATQSDARLLDSYGV
ncbi:phage tail tape measure protein [uncultured Shewanella sp.]|uniref:phage tail tape measure protein n=1 Tax=uncultured Shewanella sp. TaxID=173975 RepID=UPI002606647A|nr:phage tail tape measure protein [uncultured Shewanella sp.]